MEETTASEMLARLKMLLGTEDGGKDELLSFIIADTEQMILSYCRIDTIPKQLQSLVPVIAADYYRAKGYGKEQSPDVVKSITEGDMSVSYAETQPGADFFKHYSSRLKPFVNRKGRVPSDFKSI